jgi:integrase
LAKATPLLRDVAMMMLQTGMRPEEVYRIQPENVHLSKAYLVNPFGKTRAARRRINLTKAALKILKRRMDERQGPTYFRTTPTLSARCRRSTTRMIAQ